jgi:mevalonate kinase
MPLTTASAPGKVILFGEHAVVSGIAALGAAINLRAKVSIEDLPGAIEVDARNLKLMLEGFTIDPDTGKIHTVGSSKGALLATKYISAVLREFDAGNLRVVVESEIPPSAGLGSSAAIVVATVAALNQHIGLDLSQKEIAEQSHRIEKHVQKGLGSPMDTSLATFGGYQLVSKAAEPVDLPSFDLVVGCTNIPHDTRVEVDKVQKLRTMYPEII